MNTHFNVSDQELAAANGGVDLSEFLKNMGPIPKPALRVIHRNQTQKQSGGQILRILTV